MRQPRGAPAPRFPAPSSGAARPIHCGSVGRLLFACPPPVFLRVHLSCFAPSRPGGHGFACRVPVSCRPSPAGSPYGSRRARRAVLSAHYAVFPQIYAKAPEIFRRLAKCFSCALQHLSCFERRTRRNTFRVLHFNKSDRSRRVSERMQIFA